jgi:3-hydroxyacyl-[acyl-carrier-protein] dehydratase
MSDETKNVPRQLVEDGKGYDGPAEDLLPHRKPFLFLDKLLYSSQKRYVAEVTFTEDMWFFKGHFPEYPVVPGVILVESVAQCGGAGLVASGLVRNGVFLLISVDNVKFRRQVRPGDKLRMEVDNIRVTSRVAKQHGKAFVGDELVMESDFMCVLGPNK